MQYAVDVDVRFERERRVEHRLDALLPVLGDRRLDPVRAGRGLLEDVSARHRHRPRGTARCSIGEVGVAQHVRGDEHVLRERIGVDEIRLARIAREHHLEDPRVSHVARTSWWM